VVTIIQILEAETENDESGGARSMEGGGGGGGEVSSNQSGLSYQEKEAQNVHVHKPNKMQHIVKDYIPLIDVVKVRVCICI